MNLADGRLAPSPGGDGLVARTSGAVLFVAARTPADDVALLVDAFHGASGPTPARDLARAFARVVSDDADTSLPGFAVLAETGSGVYVKVYGPVEVELQGEGGAVERLSGVGSFTGMDRELSGPFHTVVCHRAGEVAPAPAFDVDLGSGSVPAAGFALTTMTSPTDAVVADIPPAMAGTGGDAGDGSDPQAAMADEPSPEPAPQWAPEGPPSAPAPDWGAEQPSEPAPDWGAEHPSEPAAPFGAPLEQPTQAWSPDEVRAATDAGATADEAALDDLPVVPAPEEPAPPADMVGADVRSLEELPIADEPAAAGSGDVGPAPATADVAEPPPMAEPPSAPEPPVAAPDPGAAAAAAGGFTSQLLGALDVDEVDDRDALPVEPEPGEVRQADQVTSEVVVQGIVCSRGHFNDPRSRYCSSCGISMVQVTNVLTNGPRPPLGVMVFEDGAAFSLSTDYVVGRQPEVSDLVRDGLALPLTVDDPERSISRAHAELRLVDWDVHLVNLSGTNGSFVWDEAAQQWITIPEGQSVVLTPGMRVALGRRSAVFESSLR